MIDLFFLLSLFLICVMVHEFGHWIYFKRALKKDVFIYFGKYLGKLRLFTGIDKDYKGIASKQLRDIYSSGVIMGACPLVISLVYQSQAPYIILVAIFYFLGCSTDLEKIKELSNRKV